MDYHDGLAQEFETRRRHLGAVAYRMLGSLSEADDAVQEAWLRVSNSDLGAVGNFGGWLTTVVARVCLDQLRSRRTRREDSLDALAPGLRVATEASAETETDLLLADSVGPALLVVLDTLGPAERVAFVLHDMFDLPFDEIATILGRSPDSARQLASRARRRIRGGGLTPDADPDLQRKVVDAFLVASRQGDFAELLAVLDPQAELTADPSAVEMAAASKWGGRPELPAEVRGAKGVAEALSGRGGGARPALIDGLPGAAAMRRDQVLAVWVLSVRDGKIARVDLIADRSRLATLDVELNAPPSTAA
jgi:RNA polymerase sigma-70 factor, ECF subfamily